jgi:hypothetical protein
MKKKNYYSENFAGRLLWRRALQLELEKSSKSLVCANYFIQFIIGAILPRSFFSKRHLKFFFA